jgi:hypothetical protein
MLLLSAALVSREVLQKKAQTLAAEMLDGKVNGIGLQARTQFLALAAGHDGLDFLQKRDSLIQIVKEFHYQTL